MAERITALSRQEIIKHTPEGEDAKSIGSSFFRGEHCNFNPYVKDFARSNFLEKFLLKGLTPSQPFIAKGTKVTAFGSCFAANITRHLGERGYNLSKNRTPDIYISEMGEGLVNVHALAQQFEWALEDMQPPVNLWHGFKAEEFGYDDAIRQKTKAAFLETEFFIITLGLSEVWYDEVTGGVFWRAVPQKNYDPTRHKFKVCGMEETKEKIAYMYRAIRKHVPQARVLFTLSPVPLAATFRPINCLAANSASKAILRAALDEFYRENVSDLNERLFYFPSYEIVTELFFHRYTGDGRHAHEYIIAFIMKLFEAVHCQDGPRLSEMMALYKEARRENARTIPEIT